MNSTFTISFDTADLISLWRQTVATLADFTAKLDSLDSKVTDIAKEIADLKAQLANGGLTPDEEAQVMARLDTLSSSLDAAK